MWNVQRNLGNKMLLKSLSDICPLVIINVIVIHKMECIYNCSLIFCFYFIIIIISIN